MPDQQASTERRQATPGEVRLLGRVRLVGPRGPVALPDGAGPLLGLLALRPNEPVPDAELLAALAGRDALSRAGARPLDRAATLLAAALAGCGSPGALEIRPTGYLLRMPSGRIDASRFSRLLDRARRRMAAGELRAAVRLFRAALAVWPEPLPGRSAGRRMEPGADAGDPYRLCPSGWAAVELGRLRQARIDAFEDRWACALRLAVAAHAAAGGPVADRAVVAAGATAARVAGAAVAELTSAVAAHPLRARLWELLLVAAYLGQGRRAAADVHQRAREVFGEQLGVEPAGRVCVLAAAVRVGELPEDWATGHRPAPTTDVTAVPPASRARPAARLPVPLTALLGRDDLLAVVAERLDRHRLVTLTGTGGAGKTRLAVAAAGSRTDRPVWFVDLTAVESPVRVPQAVAAALGVPDVGRDIVEALAADLGPVRALLVLDNCEHLVTGCAELVERLLSRCPGLRVLATSRVPLRLPAEARIRVPALAVPEAGTGLSLAALAAHPATRLFLERAREFAGRPLPEASADAVVRLCADLDGLPLAIELAAARTPMLTVQEIIERLRTDVRLLRSPDPRPPDRHRSVAAAVESSLALLDADACRLFDRLSICAAGFDAEAARSIGGPSAPAALAALVEASLVEPLSTGPAEPVVPAGSPELAGLGASAEPVDLAGPPGPTGRAESFGPSEPADPSSGAGLPGPGEGGRTRYRMLEPVRRHALARLAGSGAEVAARQALATYCLNLAERADARQRGAARDRWLARLRAEEPNLRSAMTWLAEAGAGGPAHGDLRLAAALAMYCRLEGNYREGHGWLSTALARHPDAPAALRSRAGIGAAMLAMLACDYPAAIRHAELARAACRSTGNRRAEAQVEQILGSVAREQARYTESAVHLATAGAIFADCDDEWGEAQTTELRGFTAWLAGDLDRADSRLRASLRRHERLGDALAAASALMNLGAVALYRGDIDRASSLLDVALKRYSAIGFPEGVGWAHNLRGLVELRGGRTRRAARHLRLSLAAHRQVGDRWRTASVLEALAEVARQDGDPVRGARLLGAADRIREEIGAPVPACERADTEATERALRAQLEAPVRQPRVTGSGGFALAHRYGREAPLDAVLAGGARSKEGRPG
ncbi:AfsR/SARP family transcriptional regulator [Plantactinospora sp. KLBMP9567]|uniref:AfsR/SARP family transcriptional regulator n=1 Tax=Plantactinospora sp. KLBMP9567 TaxID=3085900 RepID=UPI0029827B46|nr:BTAD domain-containing putative transcriptional regulator [Plantactinospora sp. KLBMP9567]MDW5323146.1 BTAD domain-containing putative transcriptional regulator [Plantactinospora sp. KLBMP9567]